MWVWKFTAAPVKCDLRFFKAKLKTRYKKKLDNKKAKLKITLRATNIIRSKPTVFEQPKLLHKTKVNSPVPTIYYKPRTLKSLPTVKTSAWQLTYQVQRRWSWHSRITWSNTKHTHASEWWVGKETSPEGVHAHAHMSTCVNTTMRIRTQWETVMSYPSRALRWENPDYKRLSKHFWNS